MHTYAIAHLGSCTTALSFFKEENHQIAETFHTRAPLCLGSHVNSDQTIDRKGIQLAEKTLDDFSLLCKEHQIEHCWCDITSPARLVNGQELINALKRTGFEIYPLKGVEEAACEFLGTRFSFPDITNGIAFNIGGASTRLISFHNGKVLDAAMFAPGRMSEAKDALDQFSAAVQEARDTYDTLNTPCATMIGIGDTVEDIAHVCNAFWPNTKMKHIREVIDVRRRITAGDPEVCRVIEEQVPSSRQAAFLTGYDMFMILAEIYEADRIMISPTGITEGFLLSRLDDMK